jgi:hypothetical protein
MCADGSMLGPFHHVPDLGGPETPGKALDRLVRENAHLTDRVRELEARFERERQRRVIYGKDD